MISGVPRNHPGEEWEVIEEEQVIIVIKVVTKLQILNIM
jgi:hypothetical protein